MAEDVLCADWAPDGHGYPYAYAPYSHNLYLAHSVG